MRRYSLYVDFRKKILWDQTVFPDVVLSTYIHDKGFFMRTSINSKGIIDDLKENLNLSIIQRIIPCTMLY